MRPFALALPVLSLALLALATGCTGEDGGGGDPGPTPTPRTFWSWDLSVMPPVDKEVPASERALTENFYVYVEDALWEAGEVTPEQLDELVIALEDATPAGSINTSAGIIDNNVATFGPIPDAMDGDPRIYLLLMNIEGFNNFEFDGFFRAIDQEPDGADPNYHSNEIEMLYVNAEIRPVNTETTKSVIAHEIVHLLEWGQDPSEEGWLSETFGELGMTVNGFYTDENWVEDFAAHPEESLYGGEFSVHYGACLLFGNYLYERFGAAFISDLAARTTNGTASIDAALVAAAAGVTYEQVFLDWVAANALDATGIHGYTFADVPQMTMARTVVSTADGAAAIAVPDPGAAQYVKISTEMAGTVTVAHGASAPAGARIVVMRYSSIDPTNTFEVTLADPGVPTFPVEFDATYDEAIIGLVAFSSAQTFTIDVTP